MIHGFTRFRMVAQWACRGKGLQPVAYTRWTPSGRLPARRRPLAAFQRHQRKRGAVLLVVVVERVVPPAAVLFMYAQNNVAQVFLVKRAILRLELLDAQS